MRLRQEGADKDLKAHSTNLMWVNYKQFFISLPDVQHLARFCSNSDVDIEVAAVVVVGWSFLSVANLSGPKL